MKISGGRQRKVHFHRKKEPGKGKKDGEVKEKSGQGGARGLLGEESNSIWVSEKGVKHWNDKATKGKKKDAG